ncbi:MAG: acyl carrier protein [Candidatus Methylomirabilis sp.]|nr:acyl carrier protein [Deltaproteobacteria bacterium]
MNTFEQVVKIITSVMEDADAASIRPESRFKEDLGAHSMDFVEMLYALEETFDVSTESLELEHIRTVGDIVGFIEGAVAA